MGDFEDFDNYDNDNLGRNPSPLIIIGLGLALATASIAGLAKGLYEFYLFLFH